MRDVFPLLAVLAFGLTIAIAVSIAAVGLLAPPLATGPGPWSAPTGEWSTDEPALEPFASNEEFVAFFERNSARHGFFFAGSDGGVMLDRPVVGEAAATELYGSQRLDDGDVSSTNVQVDALDEPDLLKTDGRSAFVGAHRITREGSETVVVDLSEPTSPTRVATIPAAGKLLLVEALDVLVVFEADRIVGYDVTAPDEPSLLWEEDIEGAARTARLDGDQLYVIFVDGPDLDGEPCTHAPYADEEIACSEILRPTTDVEADSVYTVARIDPGTGELLDQTSIVGSSYRTATYMSEDAMYLTYSRSMSDHELLMAFLMGPGADHLDPDAVERIERLNDRDLTERAKRTELFELLEEWSDGLSEQVREVKREQLEREFRSFVETHHRDFVRTGIIRISLGDTLEVEATGEVPGYPLNQWSMDEHDGYLRIATTVPTSHGIPSVNDVYVLDDTLSITGSVTGLGETERVYAVRFEGDEGHVVTFRQIDPFYTLDLSNPHDPRLEGELKIPGVSHYLHPLDDDGELMLGVGEEDRRVKLSLFDVSDRERPTEIDTAFLGSEGFSAVNQNHRAFLHDERHEVFFVPAEKHSFVFSYASGELNEVARIDMGGPGVRAMYAGDYLYVFSSEGLVVMNERTWEIESELRFR